MVDKRFDAFIAEQAAAAQAPGDTAAGLNSAGALKRITLPDAQAAETGETIKDKLEDLSGTDRLDASAIQNLPSGGGTAQTGAQIVTLLEALTGDGRLAYGALSETPTIPPAPTGASIKALLEALTGSARLQASAIQGLPSGGTSGGISNANLTKVINTLKIAAAQGYGDDLTSIVASDLPATSSATAGDMVLRLSDATLHRFGTMTTNTVCVVAAAATDGGDPVLGWVSPDYFGLGTFVPTSFGSLQGTAPRDVQSVTWTPNGVLTLYDDSFGNDKIERVRIKGTTYNLNADGIALNVQGLPTAAGEKLEIQLITADGRTLSSKTTTDWAQVTANPVPVDALPALPEAPTRNMNIAVSRDNSSAKATITQLISTLGISGYAELAAEVQRLLNSDANALAQHARITSSTSRATFGKTQPPPYPQLEYGLLFKKFFDEPRDNFVNLYASGLSPAALSAMAANLILTYNGAHDQWFYDDPSNALNPFRSLGIKSSLLGQITLGNRTGQSVLSSAAGKERMFGGFLFRNRTRVDGTNYRPLLRINNTDIIIIHPTAGLSVQQRRPDGSGGTTVTHDVDRADVHNNFVVEWSPPQGTEPDTDEAIWLLSSLRTNAGAALTASSAFTVKLKVGFWQGGATAAVGTERGKQELTFNFTGTDDRSAKSQTAVWVAAGENPRHTEAFTAQIINNANHDNGDGTTGRLELRITASVGINEVYSLELTQRVTTTQPPVAATFSEFQINSDTGNNSNPSAFKAIGTTDITSVAWSMERTYKNGTDGDPWLSLRVVVDGTGEYLVPLGMRLSQLLGSTIRFGADGTHITNILLFNYANSAPTTDNLVAFARAFATDFGLLEHHSGITAETLNFLVNTLQVNGVDVVKEQKNFAVYESNTVRNNIVLPVKPNANNVDWREFPLIELIMNNGGDNAHVVVSTDTLKFAGSLTVPFRGQGGQDWTINLTNNTLTATSSNSGVAAGFRVVRLLGNTSAKPVAIPS